MEHGTAKALGAAGGATLGFFLGGPIGAIIGGAVGFFAAGAAKDAEPANGWVIDKIEAVTDDKSRPTEAEFAMLDIGSSFVVFMHRNDKGEARPSIGANLIVLAEKGSPLTIEAAFSSVYRFPKKSPWPKGEPIPAPGDKFTLTASKIFYIYPKGAPEEMEAPPA